MREDFRVYGASMQGNFRRAGRKVLYAKRVSSEAGAEVLGTRADGFSGEG